MVHVNPAHQYETNAYDNQQHEKAIATNCGTHSHFDVVDALLMSCCLYYSKVLFRCLVIAAQVLSLRVHVGHMVGSSSEYIPQPLHTPLSILLRHPLGVFSRGNFVSCKLF